MPNTFKPTTGWVAMDTLRILVNSLEIGQFFNTSYNKEFRRPFAVGEQVQVKAPQRYLIRDGQGYSAQNLDRRSCTITMDQTFGIDFEWDSFERAIKMEKSESELREQYITPAAKQLAAEIDSRCALFAYQNTPNVVGALGTNPTATSTYQSARSLLKQLSCPAGKKGMIVSPPMMTSLVTASSGLQTWFSPATEIERAFKEGAIGKAAGFDWYESMSLYSHTCGVWQTPASVKVKTTSVNGATSVVCDCTTGDTFKKGDIVSFASAYAVNPVTRRSTGALKQFVVTEDATGASSEVTLKIYPAIEGPGSQYQNVSAFPTDEDVLVLFPGTTAPSTGPKAGINGLALHGDAFAMVFAELENPKKAELAEKIRDPETGIEIALVRDFDIQDRKFKTRFDVHMGFGVLYAENCAVRVASST